MKKIFNKLFNNDNILAILAILGVVSFIILLFIKIDGLIIIKLGAGLITLLLIMTIFTFFKHEKNVTKASLGGQLASLLMLALSLTYLSLDTFSTIFYILTCLTLFLILANHLFINSSHHSSSKSILLNQLAFIILLVLEATITIYLFVIDATYCFLNLYLAILIFSNIGVVICIESKLDSYRLNRESLGWKEDVKENIHKK